MQVAGRQTAIVVDDDPMIRSILRSALSSIGLEVHLGSHGHEAVSLAGKLQAKLVLLDLAMPGLDGLSACARIRNLPDYETVPIIVLTAKIDPLVPLAASEARVTLVINKPFQPATLLQTVSGYLHMSSTARGVLARSATEARQISDPAGNDQRTWR